LLLLLSCIGGTTFLWIEVALSDFGPLWLVAYRISIAAVVMVVIWQIRGGKLFVQAVSCAAIVTLVSICFLTTILPFLLISWGQQYVTSGFAGIALASSALIVSPLAHLLVPGERMSIRSTVGLTFGFLGVVFLISPAWQTGTYGPHFVLGELACILAAGCYALSSVLISRLPPVDPVGLTAITLTIAGIVVFLAALIFAEPMTRPSIAAMSALGLLALASTAGSNLLVISLIRQVGPNFLAISSFIAPLIAVATGALVLGETVALSDILGFLLILSGMALGKYGFRHRDRA
jgi:drug/metabolite transporter (DMT)-like permease